MDILGILIKMADKIYKKYGYEDPLDMLYDYCVLPSRNMSSHHPIALYALVIKEKLLK